MVCEMIVKFFYSNDKNTRITGATEPCSACKFTEQIRSVTKSPTNLFIFLFLAYYNH